MPNDEHYDGAWEIPRLKSATSCLEERNADESTCSPRFVPLTRYVDGVEELRRAVYAGTQAIEHNREGMTIAGQWWWENRKGTYYFCWRLERTRDCIHSMPLNPQALKYRLDLSSLLAEL